VPSLPHEGIIELFRNRPVLAAELLQEAFDVALPTFTEARIESADLGDVIPRELRADLLVLLLDGKPVLVIIVEAQLFYPKPEKLFAWPAYVVGARARYKCPACLLIVTPDPALATYLAQPIVLGPGQAMVAPFVLGPSGVPVVADIQEAQKRPELAVLSAMAHGQTEAGLDVAVAAIIASAGIEDEEQRAMYKDLVLFSLGAAARRALEAVMSIKNYEYRSEFAREYFQKGIETGELKPFVHLFERRLGRTLTEDERATLAKRVREEGADRAGDVVLDLSQEDLATWLARTNGH
jgi:hypothetical protein